MLVTMGFMGDWQGVCQQILGSESIDIRLGLNYPQSHISIDSDPGHFTNVLLHQFKTFYLESNLLPSYSSQFSTFNSDTLLNSFTFAVTIIQSKARQCAAINKSLGTIIFPLASRVSLISP